MMETDLNEYLKIWQDVGEHTASGHHLASDTLYRMAGDGGLEKAPPAEVAHLSMCPVCVKKWAEWRRALSAVASLEADKPAPILTYGIRQAAATEKTAAEPVRLPSACGRFVLSLLPRMDDPDKGMVTLEVVGEAGRELEGQQVIVKDRLGVVMIAGRLREGRLARRCDQISTFNLTPWTLVVHPDPS